MPVAILKKQVISYFHIIKLNDRHKSGSPVLFADTDTHQISFSSRQNNRDNYLLPEQEPASGSIQWPGEANQSAHFIQTDEWMTTIEKQGQAGPAELLTVPGWLIHEVQRSGRAKIQPR